jgi:hypothetical protein
MTDDYDGGWGSAEEEGEGLERLMLNRRRLGEALNCGDLRDENEPPGSAIAPDIAIEIVEKLSAKGAPQARKRK